MYELISPIYSELFPSENRKTEFCLAEAERAAGASKICRILDVGCADGELAVLLAEDGHRVTGIDLSTEMIQAAKLRKADTADRIRQQLDFQAAGMKDISSFGSFGLILCLGNTLPHLSSEDAVKTFFKDTQKSLLTGGIFILQILNFDLILKNRNVSFDEIKTDRHIFKRSYEFTADDRINFHISLTDRKSGMTDSDNTKLLPLTRQFIETELKAAGFDIIEVFSGFDRITAGGGSAGGTEFARVYLAR